MSIQNLEEMLEGVFADEQECEIESHEYGTSAHSGAGEWYFTVRCTTCKNLSTNLICNAYRNVLLNELSGLYMACEVCVNAKPAELWSCIKK